MSQLHREITRGEGGPSLPADEVCTAMERLGWRLVRLMAQGTWTTVYLARPAQAPEGEACHYALKMPNQGALPQALPMLEVEACVGGKVASPYVVPVLDAHLHAPPQFTVMPLLDGTRLDQLIAAGRRLPGALAVWIARQIAEGLASLHEAGWLHLDLKPANVLVLPPGHAVLMDLAFCQRPGGPPRAANHAWKGTPAYAAPEWISGQDRVDERADLYSLGIVLYEMLAGEPPLRAGSLGELARLHREFRPPNPRMQIPGLDRNIAELIQSLLAKDRLRRPDCAREVVRRLAAAEIAFLEDTALRWSESDSPRAPLQPAEAM